MAFLADTFFFDNASCDDYELVLAGIDGGGDSNSAFASAPEISDVYLPRKWRSHFYGVTRPEKLTFELSCMLTPCRIDAEEYLTREEIETISRWLTSPDSYRWLQIQQEDMMTDGSNPTALYRYRCLVTGLELIFVNDYPCGVRITVTCDSPYAYLPHYSTTRTVTINGQPTTVSIMNSATPERGVNPVLTFDLSDDLEDEIGPIKINNTTTGEELTISTLPTTVRHFVVDCERQIISADDGSNLYQYCNFVFPHLARGTNSLTVSISGPNIQTPPSITLDIDCDFPVDIGA